MSRIKRCIMGVLFLAIVMTGIYFYQDSSNEVQAETQVVNKDMLSLKFQVGQGTAQGKIRVVASVDSPNYSAVGFDIAKDNNEPQELTIDTKKYPLPQRIKSSVEGMEYSFSPKVVDTSSEYFLTGKWTADPNVKYTVCAWVKTFEGDKICGQSRCITLSDLTATTYLNMSFELNEGCTLSKTGEDAYADINVTYNGTPTTAKVISVNGSSVHVNVQNVDRTTLPSATKFVFKNSDGTECGSTIFRNLYTSYSETTEGETTTNTADTSWYDVYLEENKDENEFVIATSADLYGLPMLVNSTDAVTFNGKIIYLCADIEANKGEAAETGWDSTKVEGGTEYPWTPIGTSSASFNGTFDGQGHAISGIIAKQDYRAALFAWTGSNSVFKDFILMNSYFEGKEYNGSIAGRLDGSLYNISSDAIVKGSSSTNGGLVGFIYAPSTGKSVIKDCCFTGSVQAGLTEAELKNFAGGMVGALWQGNLEVVNCEVTGTVGATQYYAGGILGGLNNGDAVATIDIKNCRFLGTIKNTGGHSGGIIGSAYENTDTINITNCSVGGEINAGSRSGGLIGQIGGGTVTIGASSFAGNLKASDYYYAGGLIGIVVGGTVNINNSNFEDTGKVEAKETAGGLVGYAMGGTVIIDNSSAAGEVASTWSVGGLVSRVANGTVEIKNSSFEEEGKFTKGNYSGGIIGRVESGTAIINGCHANSMTAPGHSSGGIVGYVGGGNVTIGNSYFSGQFDTSAENAGGLVGYILRGTLGIENSYFDGDFTSTTNYAGGIVGTIGAVSSGCDVTVDIKSCYAKGTVSANGSHIGGIIGRVTYLTNKVVSLTDCLNAASVSGGNWTGGLFGRTHKTSGTIKMTRCLNIGAINSSSSVSAGSAVGGADQAPTVEAVYAVINNTVSKACGNNTFAVTTCELKDITVGNGVTAEKIKTETLSGLFTAENTIWTIGTTEGSTPKLNLTTQ